jgi:hypothetical protein
MSGGFLERWSRRKADEGKADEGQRPPEPDSVAAATPAAQTEPATTPDAPPLLSDEELAALPRIEDLTSESSLAPFLRAGVPAPLKNAAMRKMWLMNPTIRDHKDCAVDYHWDWNTPGGVPGNGGRLEPGAVQKMLRGLTDPRPAPAAEAAKKPLPSNETTAGTVAEAKAPPPADEAPDGEKAPVCDPQPATGLPGPEDSEPRKRHGGATPS